MALLANSDEQQLLDAVARGDTAAFERLYRAHKDDLLTAADFLLCGDRSAAEDVLHDVFVALARRASSITLTGSLRNYLLTSCLNRARDVLKQRRRELPSHADVAERREPVSEHRIESDTADELQRLADDLRRLADEQREVVTLHIHGGLKFREIAEMLGISINTVQSRYRYALASLRRLIERQKAHEE
jgi:RNA polymerase sigma-70 factor (ECF subfamily)